jgi:hypothetical protein
MQIIWERFIREFFAGAIGAGPFYPGLEFSAFALIAPLSFSGDFF